MFFTLMGLINTDDNGKPRHSIEGYVNKMKQIKNW